MQIKRLLNLQSVHHDLIHSFSNSAPLIRQRIAACSTVQRHQQQHASIAELIPHIIFCIAYSQ